MIRPTAAQRDTRARAVDLMHQGAKLLDDVEVLSALEALLHGRPGVSPRDLDEFANRIQRLAWNLEREAMASAHPK